MTEQQIATANAVLNAPAPEFPTAVATVRMVPSLYERAARAARFRKTSLNKFCLQSIECQIEIAEHEMNAQCAGLAENYRAANGINKENNCQNSAASA